MKIYVIKYTAIHLFPFKVYNYNIFRIESVKVINIRKKINAQLLQIRMSILQNNIKHSK